MKTVTLFFSILAALSAVVLLAPSTSQASDHVDGPISIANQVADIIDLFAFPTPGTPGSLTLILDVYPFVSSSGHFSDRVNYNFILRKAALAQDGSGLVTDPKSEVVVTCRFITPQQVSGTQMICSSGEAPARVIGQIGFNQIEQPRVGNNITLFGGRRADPFFLSKDFASNYMQFKPAKADATNVMNNLNCLSIVINVGIDQLFPSSAQAAGEKTPKTSAGRKVAQVDSFLIAVAAESLTFDQAGAQPRRIDRVGRPEVTNVSLNFKAGGAEIRDTYNSDRPYEVALNKMAAYVTRLKKQIGLYDQVDGRKDLDEATVSRLATIMADDYLVVDPFTPCRQTSFFEIEKATLLGQAHRSCGGRDLTDNVVNKLYTLYQKGPAAMESLSVSDGLTGPSKPVSKQFPYEAEPYDGVAAWIAEKLANALKSHL